MAHASQRPPAVAGLFYPADPNSLHAQVAGFLSAALPAEHIDAPKALIAPHAGYIYSGAVAACAYAGLAQRRDLVRRVLLLCPTHRVAVRGLALPAAQSFITPLGAVPVDREAWLQARELPGVIVDDRPHAEEHAIEVQLPFLQSTLDHFAILPVAVGHADPLDVAGLLEALWGGPETLIVISSDLSHYQPYRQAQWRDKATIAQIRQLDASLSPDQACGAGAINGLLLAAQRHRLTPHVLDLRNSGDTAGDRERVVGYASIAFSEDLDRATIDEDLGHVLLDQARQAINAALGQPALPARQDPRLAERGATFVTLTIDGELRGCIGSLNAHRALGDDVRDNAVAAALRDSRFAPLPADELLHIRIEVSLLTEPDFIDFKDEADALAQLEPGRDGVILFNGCQKATFLPQVWEQLPERRAFMAALKQKARLPVDFWSPNIMLARYHVNKWKEPAPGE